MYKNRKFSTMNVAQFNKMIEADKSSFAWHQWRDLKRNAKNMLKATNSYGVQEWYNYAEQSLCVLKGIYSVKDETDNAFRFTLDLSTTLLHVMQRKRASLRK